MNLSLRRLGAAILALGLLVGCSKTSPAPDTPVELTVINLLGFPREPLDEAIDLYEEKHSNVKIKVKELQGFQSFTQDGKPNTAAFEGGDLVIMPWTMSRTFYRHGAFRELSNVRMPTFDPAVAGLIDELTKLDGVRFGFPISLEPATFYLNTAAFETAGLEPPSVDWTTQEFEQTLMQLKAAGSNTDLLLMAIIEPLVRSYGSTLYDAASQQWHFDSPESKQALAWIGQMTKEGLLQHDMNAGPRTIRLGGPDGPALSPTFTGSFRIMPGMSLQPMPKGPAGRFTPMAATLGLVLSSSANPEVATDFLTQMVSGPEQQLALGRAGIRPLISDEKAMAAWREAVGDRTADAVELSWENGFIDSGARRMEFMIEMAPFFAGKAELESTLANVKAKFGQ